MKIRTIGFISIVIIGGVWYISQHPGIFSRTKEFVSQATQSDRAEEVLSKIFATKTTIQFRDPIAIEAASVIEETNKQRVAQGLVPLAITPLLNSSAEYKTDDMITRQYFEHESPTGEGVSDLGKRAGYEYVIMGENLALGDFADAKDLVDAWMNSPGHRANILSTKYQDIGVSVKRATFEGKPVWFAVQHFGSARGVCPLINENQKADIDFLNIQLREEEGDIQELKNKLQSPGADVQPWYQNDVARFNNMVDLYNKKLADSRKKIDMYNAQVRAFNKCIATFQ